MGTTKIQAVVRSGTSRTASWHRNIIRSALCDDAVPGDVAQLCLRARLRLLPRGDIHPATQQMLYHRQRSLAACLGHRELSKWLRSLCQQSSRCGCSRMMRVLLHNQALQAACFRVTKAIQNRNCSFTAAHNDRAGQTSCTAQSSVEHGGRSVCAGAHTVADSPVECPRQCSCTGNIPVVVPCLSRCEQCYTGHTMRRICWQNSWQSNKTASMGM